VSGSSDFKRSADETASPASSRSGKPVTALFIGDYADTPPSPPAIVAEASPATYLILARR